MTSTEALRAELATPVIKRPPGGVRPRGVLLSVPHYGTRPLPGFADEAFADPAFARFPRGYADTLADRLYDDLHDTGCHLLLA
ncbi:MAG: hypothetical protein KDK91_30035, partial [Gammaproteobacteria bacterium]|nr:hypothetical protein [Gammaproteobacteria bacterium]